MQAFEVLDLEQGTPEWLELRKTKITATDAAVIMGASHYKTKLQLYQEKLGIVEPAVKNNAMQRGVDLEPIARSLYSIKTGIEVYPQVIVKDWLMASLDGISTNGDHLVEIKCPGSKNHAIALAGKIPPIYYPQMQHQMYVCDLERSYYFSFDGVDGVIVEVNKDLRYIEKLLVEAKKFYECLINKIPPND